MNLTIFYININSFKLFNNMNSDSEDCTTDDIYPFVLTVKAGKAFVYGIDHKSDEDCHGTQDCHDCCCMCFPCTIAIDLVTLVPFSGIYFGKKLCKYCKKDSVIPQVTPIVTQPAKMPTPI